MKLGLYQLLVDSHLREMVLAVNLGSWVLLELGARAPRASWSSLPGASVTITSRSSSACTVSPALVATLVLVSTMTSLPAMHRPFSTAYLRAPSIWPCISPSFLIGAGNR